MQGSPSERPGARYARRLRGHFGTLLVVLLGSLFFQLGAPDEDWARVIVIALQGLALVLALVATAARRPLVLAALVLVAIAVVGSTLAALGEGGLAEIPARVTTLLLIATAPYAIGRAIARDFRAGAAISVQTMFGVLCLYLFLGLLFSASYGAIAATSSEPFFGRAALDVPANFLYFSFATLTTVGYGDLVATTDPGRSLAILEALLGQIYMVTVVAVIVSNLGRRRGGRAGAAGPSEPGA